MSLATTILTILAAAWVGFSAYSLLTQKAFVVEPLLEYGVPRTWWPWLGLAKAAGAVGLLVGLAVFPIGLAAAIGIVLYFIGAIITIVRAHAYSHIAFPLLYAIPVAAAMTLQVA